MEERITEQPAAVAEAGAVLEQAVSPQAAAPWYRRRNPLIAAAVVVVAAGIGLGFALSGGDVTVHGSLSMGLLTYSDDAPGADVMNPKPGDPCSTSGGYADIAPGDAVTIGGATGQTVAVAALSAGKVNGAGECEFDFSASVSDQAKYTATIGTRGTTTWTKAQATSKAGMTLSLSYAG